MNWWIFGGVMAGIVVFCLLGQRFRLIDLRGRGTGRGSGGASLTGIGDEVFAPTRHEAAVELDRQTVLPAPAPVAGDGDRGVYDGRMRIDLSADGEIR